MKSTSFFNFANVIKIYYRYRWFWTGIIFDNIFYFPIVRTATRNNHGGDRVK